MRVSPSPLGFANNQTGTFLLELDGHGSQAKNGAAILHCCLCLCHGCMKKHAGLGV